MEITVDKIINHPNIIELIEDIKKDGIVVDELLDQLIEHISNNGVTKEQGNNIVAFLQLYPVQLQLEFLQKGVLFEENFHNIMLGFMAPKYEELVLEIIEAMGFNKEEVKKSIAELENNQSNNNV